MIAMTQSSLESVSHETRVFEPAKAFSKKAHIASMEEYERLYQDSIDRPEVFWARVASELSWMKHWESVLNKEEAPYYRWFEGGKTNVCYNCVDRHVEAGDGAKIAYYWEGEPGDTRTLTFSQVQQEVCKLANAFKSLGIGKGDRVAIYLPMIPELVFSMLACARIGAIHTVIFAGFSSEAIHDRLDDSKAKLVVTADGSFRRGKRLNLKSFVDNALGVVTSVESVLVVRRLKETSFHCPMFPGRDHWYHALVDQQSAECLCEPMDSEDILFLLYTSGTTGKPKGIVHTTGGYMVYSYLTAKYTFDLQKDDVYWCTADIGWITGHSYTVYGPMQSATTQLMFEGAPNWPQPDRFWDLIERYKVSIFYTAPTAIRSFMKWGDAWVDAHDLSSLRLLGTVGEPINPEAWMWYHKKIGRERCPIADTWWQTETGGHMLTPLPGATPTKPGSATKPFFGIDAAVLDEDGNEVSAGMLAIRKPWPGMLRGIWGDSKRFEATYWSKWGGKYYFPSDGAHKDEDGYFWLLGRIDDVVNISGHRIGTAELESVFVEHPSVAESAVVGVPHPIKGQGLVAFVTVRDGVQPSDALRSELMHTVDQKIGKFARPEYILFSRDLPKTRSGKIMRRILRDIAEENPIGNVTTLADPSVVEELQKQYSQLLSQV
jgi:acetyl-CoA synthetase